MSEIPQAWVENVADVLTNADPWKPDREVARAVLAAVLPDVRREVAEVALREAADDVRTAWYADMVPERVTQLQLADYLDKRAARIARQAGDPR